jgi:hypothetical protein
MVPFTEYTPGTLVVLIGENPLPNYVAVRLLATVDTQVILLHTSETTEQKNRLITLLCAHGYQHNNIVELVIHDSNPAEIRRVVSDMRSRWAKPIHINYTGGTKAMSVNAMLALSDPQLFSSYIDARTLSLWIEGPGITGARQVPISINVNVTVKELLDLHGLPLKKKSPMRATSVLLHTSLALLDVYLNPDRRKTWKEWFIKEFRAGQSHIDIRNNQEQNGRVCIADLPDPHVRVAISLDSGAVQTLAELAGKAQDGWPFKKPDADLPKWFDGGWLEDYTLAQLQQHVPDLKLHDTQANINPELPGDQNEFEFDVAATRGHQLFAFSCTTLDKKGPLKLKLLEAVVRAEQIGGSESRVALVCCAERKTVESLKQQVQTLTHKNMLRVFGADDLPDLGKHIARWIRESVQEAV